MTPQEKEQVIESLSEDDLRRKVLIPLLSKLGFIDPIHHHHPNEKGKDIICKEFDRVFKKVKYIAVVVKRGNVTGSACSSDGYFNVINQVKQALNEPYKHGSSLLCVGNGKVELSGDEVNDSDQVSGRPVASSL